MALPTGPLHSPGMNSSSSCSKPCLLPACHVLEYLISLLRAPAWQQYKRGEPACSLFLARQSTEQDTCLGFPLSSGAGL